jgi:folylpolyglutamate synthase/dihydropteroate synthase
MVLVELLGGRLRSLLQQLLLETTCLKELIIADFGHHEDLAAGLAGGLRGNKSLKKLVFVMYNAADDPDAANVITILESLLENHMLQHLSDDSGYEWGHEPYAYQKCQDVCKALVRVFPPAVRSFQILNTISR